MYAKPLEQCLAHPWHSHITIAIMLLLLLLGNLNENMYCKNTNLFSNSRNCQNQQCIKYHFIHAFTAHKLNLGFATAYNSIHTHNWTEAYSLGINKYLREYGLTMSTDLILQQFASKLFTIANNHSFSSFRKYSNCFNSYTLTSEDRKWVMGRKDVWMLKP